MAARQISPQCGFSNEGVELLDDEVGYVKETRSSLKREKSEFVRLTTTSLKSDRARVGFRHEVV